MNSQSPVQYPVHDEGKYFLPAGEFHQRMSGLSLCPYKSHFSFKPFLEHIQDQSGKKSLPEVQVFLDQMRHLLESVPDEEVLSENSAVLEQLIPVLFPALFLEDQLGFVGKPFSKDFMFMTPYFRESMSEGNQEISYANLSGHARAASVYLDAGSILLKKFYNVEADLSYSEILRVRNTDTGLEKYYKVNAVSDYISVESVAPVKRLNRDQIHRMLDNWEDQELWLRHLPPDNFRFEGLVVGQLVEVTDREVLSRLESMMVDEEGHVDQGDDLAVVQQLVRSFLDIPELDFGSMYVQESKWQESTTWSLLRQFDGAVMFPSFQDEKGAYGKTIQEKRTITIGDLQERKYLSALEKKLLEKGYRSLLLIPVFLSGDKVGGIMELGSRLPYRFNKITVLRLHDLVSIYAKGMAKFIQEIDHQVRLTMQQQFTSIHPSVEWKFRNVATAFYWGQHSSEDRKVLKPIVFKDVFPLYGQADIVGSSTLRNQFIQDDLIENLECLQQVMEGCLKYVPFHLLEVYQRKAGSCLERLQAGEFVSSDESQIVALLTREVHPLLRDLEAHYPQIPGDVFDGYFSQMDPELGILYKRRKDYEDSVASLNQMISSYLEEEDEKMQQILPHYFEKYKTDGVEYNIYVGQSILEKGTFSPFFLRDFRLWQLIHMCEITRKVKAQSAGMKVPLTTAQLIFVYNHSLSIRFRLDEKQFDVDGAYNVRYEILKKRIDKAVIKGTDERLTQSGKIAIVWLQEQDRQEYMEYLEHLVEKGYIEEEIEDLELEKLQGAEGLRALRVEVRK